MGEKNLISNTDIVPYTVRQYLGYLKLYLNKIKSALFFRNSPLLFKGWKIRCVTDGHAD